MYYEYCFVARLSAAGALWQWKRLKVKLCTISYRLGSRNSKISVVELLDRLYRWSRWCLKCSWELVRLLVGWCPFSWFFLHLQEFGIVALNSLVICSGSLLAKVWSYLILLSVVACFSRIVGFLMLGCRELFDFGILEVGKGSKQRSRFKPTIQHHFENCFHILCWRQLNALRNPAALSQFF